MIPASTVAVAIATASHAAQQEILSMEGSHEMLLRNPNLHPDIALEILKGKTSAAACAALVRHPVYADDAVAAKLGSDKRGKVRAAVVYWEGWTDRVKFLTLSSPNRTSEVDHALLHIMGSMSVEDSDQLARSAGHAFAFAAALRPGSTLTDEDLVYVLSQGKPSSPARALAPYLLAARPALAEAMLEGYRGTVAGSSVLAGKAELARKVADLEALQANRLDRKWLEDAKYAYFAFLANPFVPEDLAQQVDKICPQFQAESLSANRKTHLDTSGLTSLSGIEDADLLTWVLRRCLPSPRYGGTVRTWDLPQLVQAPAFTLEQATMVIERISWVLDSNSVACLPPARADLSAALEAIQARFEELGQQVTEVQGQFPEWVTWTVDCPQGCISYLESWVNEVCPGCEEAKGLDVATALGLRWYGQRAPHIHCLDACWGENSQVWQTGLAMLQTYCEPGHAASFEEFYLLIKDLASA